jgi:hypothetical protein
MAQVHERRAEPDYSSAQEGLGLSERERLDGQHFIKRAVEYVAERQPPALKAAHRSLRDRDEVEAALDPKDALDFVQKLLGHFAGLHFVHLVDPDSDLTASLDGKVNEAPKLLDDLRERRLFLGQVLANVGAEFSADWKGELS